MRIISTARTPTRRPKQLARVHPAALLLPALPALLLWSLLAAPAAGAEELIVAADQGETVYPLWVEAGTTVRFQVEGSWSMWHPQWEAVDYRGHTGFKKIDGHHLGTLLGAVEGGKPFPVADGLAYEPPRSGRLLLYPNRGNYRHLATLGSLRITVRGGRAVSEPEAERLLGWDLNQLDTARTAGYMSEAEKDVVLFVNKARQNPALFAELYLTSKRSSSAAARECYGEMMSAEPRPVLDPSPVLFKAARDHASDMGRSGRTGHVGTDGSSLTQRVQRYGRWSRSISENCSYGFDDPLAIVLQLLIDAGVPSRGHRKNILRPESRTIGVSIQPHAKHRFNCVQDFAGEVEAN